jgi:hypothetical protein
MSFILWRIASRATGRCFGGVTQQNQARLGQRPRDRLPARLGELSCRFPYQLSVPISKFRRGGVLPQGCCGSILASHVEHDQHPRPSKGAPPNACRKILRAEQSDRTRHAFPSPMTPAAGRSFASTQGAQSSQQQPFFINPSNRCVVGLTPHRRVPFPDQLA